MRSTSLSLLGPRISRFRLIPEKESLRSPHGGRTPATESWLSSPEHMASERQYAGDSGMGDCEGVVAVNEPTTVGVAETPVLWSFPLEQVQKHLLCVKEALGRIAHTDL